MVCILDGWGESQIKDEFNAVHVAKTPVYDRLMAVEGRARTVLAHGKAVGLPSDDDMGNSEVGHNALGSGQIADQGAKLVDKAVEDGTMFTKDGWKHLEKGFASNTLHLIGLLTKGGVHARLDQLLSVVRGAVKGGDLKGGAKKVRLHLLTRRCVCICSQMDVMLWMARRWSTQTRLRLDDKELAKLTDSDVKIASGGGRMHVTMDRYEADWNIVERGWKAHVLGEADHKFTSMKEALTELHKGEGKHVSDQFLHPFVIVDDKDKPVGTIEDGDSVCIFNFRSDRVIQISKAFEYEDFTSFDRKRFPKVQFAGMMHSFCTFVRWRFEAALKVPCGGTVNHKHQWRVPLQERNPHVRCVRDTEVRPRDILLEREQVAWMSVSCPLRANGTGCGRPYCLEESTIVTLSRHLE